MVVLLQSKEDSTRSDLEDMLTVRLKMMKLQESKMTEVVKLKLEELQELCDSIYKVCINRLNIERVEEIYAEVVAEFEAR